MKLTSEDMTEDELAEYIDGTADTWRMLLSSKKFAKRFPNVAPQLRKRIRQLAEVVGDSEGESEDETEAGHRKFDMAAKPLIADIRKRFGMRG